jgi:hypothetical protein
MAEAGKLDPIVGREKEIERVSQILSRRKKNNPILIGEPGVGKKCHCRRFSSYESFNEKYLVFYLTNELYPWI